jgi:hypothetical protein
MVKGFAISPSISKNSKIKQERKKNGKEKPAAWTKSRVLCVKLTYKTGTEPALSLHSSG